MLLMNIPTCLVDDCPNVAKAAGYCARHYAQVHKTGAFTPMTPRACLLPECDTAFIPARSDQKYCCSAHASKGWRLAKGKSAPQVKTCDLPSCAREFHTYRDWQRFCSNDHAREFARTDPETVQKQRLLMSERYWSDPTVRTRARLNRHGLTQEQYDGLFTKQGECCAICQSPDPRTKYWHIDHDHVTGRVRGILCGHCNPGLGYFGDDPQRLRAALAYLNAA